MLTEVDFPFSELYLLDFKGLNVMLFTLILGHGDSKYFHDSGYIFSKYESSLLFIIAIEDLSIFFD